MILRALPRVNRRLRGIYVLTKIFMKYIIRVTVHTNCSLTAEMIPKEGCTPPPDLHLDVRTDSAPQVRTLRTACVV